MIYAIGDIHGNLPLLQEMYNNIIEHAEKQDDPMGVKIVFLGDYIDRGKNNLGVIEFLDNLKDGDGIEHIFLFGNHEQMFINAEVNLTERRMWLENGGLQLMKELKLNPERPQNLYKTKEYKFIKKFIQIKTIPLYNDVDYVFVHGGFNKQLPVDKQREDFLVWARMEPQYYDTCHKMVVHGHTPTKDYQPYKYNNVINVDIGCGFRNQLACVALPHIRDDTLIEFIVCKY
jgi:serine/threonine protein phosphatase 1